MGSGPAPRRATTACAATTLLAAALLSCGPSPSASGTPAAHTTSPQDLCTALITHWAGVILDADQGRDTVGLDYQAMGLSGGQNEILRTVLDGARAQQRANGPAAAREFTDREAARRCADRYRTGTPTGGPW